MIKRKQGIIQGKGEQESENNKGDRGRGEGAGREGGKMKTKENVYRIKNEMEDKANRNQT